MTDEELNAGIRELIAAGDAVEETIDGVRKFRLTEQGMARAEKLIHTNTRAREFGAAVIAAQALHAAKEKP